MRWSGASRSVLALLVVALTGACGTTVPLSTLAQAPGEAGSGGLATPQAAGELGTGVGGFDGLSPADPADPAGESSTGTGNTGSAPLTSGGSAPAEPGRTSTDAAPAPGAPARGGKPITAPLRVGVTYIDNSSSEAALGVDNPSTTNARNAARAMVKGINAAGGLAGRKLEAVEYSWNSQSTSYSQDASVACETFTKDSPVQVVLDGAFGTTGGFGECLQKAGVLHITRGPEGDRQSSLSRPLHVNTGMTDDRQYGAVIAGLTASGYLAKSNQLGILLEDCPSIQRAYARTIEPLIKRLGLKTPLVRTIECVTSFSSAGPASSAISSAVLAFRQGDVDRVMFISDYESVALLLFSNNASSQGYRPGYALSSNGQAGALRSQLPEDQQPQLRGVGVSPGVDTEDDPAPTTVESRCLSYAKQAGLTPAGGLDKAFIYSPCALFLLLEAGLKRTAGASEPRSLQETLTGLGTSFTAPGLVAGRTRYSPDRLDGADAVRELGFVKSCTCMRYIGPVRPAPA